MRNLSHCIAPQIPQNTTVSVKALAEPVNCHRDCLSKSSQFTATISAEGSLA